MLKNLNFLISTFIPQKLYWHIVGLINPWSSILEGKDSPEQLYKESQDLVKVLKKLRLITKKSTVLNIGCGVGRLEYGLAKEVRSCLGIDIAPSMISIAKKYIRAKNVDFISVNGKDLKKLGNKKFDLIFSIIVFQHLPRDIFINYIKESFKHLKFGGKLFFQIPIFTDQQPPEPPSGHPWAVRSYSLDELIQVLKTSGFNSISFYDVAGNKLKGEKDQVFALGIKK